MREKLYWKIRKCSIWSLFCDYFMFFDKERNKPTYSKLQGCSRKRQLLSSALRLLVDTILTGEDDLCTTISIMHS